MKVSLAAAAAAASAAPLSIKGAGVEATTVAGPRGHARRHHHHHHQQQPPASASLLALSLVAASLVLSAAAAAAGVLVGMQSVSVVLRLPAATAAADNIGTVPKSISLGRRACPNVGRFPSGHFFHTTRTTVGGVAQW